MSDSDAEQLPPDREMLRELLETRLARVSSTMDYNGRNFIEGCAVRVYNHVTHSLRCGMSFGMDTSGPKANYCEGILETIGAHFFEGTRRYSVRVTKMVVGGQEIAIPRALAVVYPELNGIGDDGTVRCNVMRIGLHHVKEQGVAA